MKIKINILDKHKYYTLFIRSKLVKHIQRIRMNVRRSIDDKYYVFSVTYNE